MKTERECPACAGQGEIDHKPFSTMGDYRECPECGGSGEISLENVMREFDLDTRCCPTCHGEGWAMYGQDILPCKKCGGGKE